MPARSFQQRSQEIRMKFLQSAFCGFLLTVTAAAQTAPAPSSAATPTPKPAATPQASTPRISSLGGDTVKGPEHPLTLEQMTSLYDAMGYQKLLSERRDAIIAQQKQGAPFIPQDVWDDLQTSWSKIDYPTAFLDVYKKYISTEDAAKLIDFSKTEAGKHYFESVPALTQALSAALVRPQQQVFQEVGARHKDEIEAARKKYQEENAPKPAPSLGPPTPSGSSAPSSATPPAVPATPPASTTPPTAPKN
jgi:hypothetical protein